MFNNKGKTSLWTVILVISGLLPLSRPAPAQSTSWVDNNCRITSNASSLDGASVINTHRFQAQSQPYLLYTARHNDGSVKTCLSRPGYQQARRIDTGFPEIHSAFVRQVKPDPQRATAFIFTVSSGNGPGALLNTYRLELANPVQPKLISVNAANVAALTTGSRLAINGIGPILVGMTVTEASRAAGMPLLKVQSGGEPYCSYYKPKTLEGVKFMVIKGQIARVDVTTRQIKTLSGVGVGDRETFVQTQYPKQIRATPHHYVERGHYLTFIPKDPADRNYRVVFETNPEGVVTMIRAGKLPEAEWIEGCL